MMTDIESKLEQDFKNLLKLNATPCVSVCELCRKDDTSHLLSEKLALP